MVINRTCKLRQVLVLPNNKLFHRLLRYDNPCRPRHHSRAKEYRGRGAHIAICHRLISASHLNGTCLGVCFEKKGVKSQAREFTHRFVLPTKGGAMQGTPEEAVGWLVHECKC